LTSLSSDRMDLKNLKSVELINNEAGKYLPLTFVQNSNGLVVNLPDRPFGDLAYVIRLSFKGKIPPLYNYADFSTNSHYYIVPGDNPGNLILGSDLKLTGKRKDLANQWKLESEGKGIYKIVNRENDEKVFECSKSNHKPIESNFTGGDNQLWRIEHVHNGLFKISNKQFPDMILALSESYKEGSKAEFFNSNNASYPGWNIKEVCEMKEEPYKPHTIPGTIEAEDFDTGCPGDAYYDTDEINQGGMYRSNEGVDIDVCSEGGYTLGWTSAGEWVAYTVTVSKPATYQVAFYTATNSDNAKLHLECDGENKTGIVSIPNTEGFQSWKVVKKNIKLDAGNHILKMVIDGGPLNLDKMVFEEIK
ncbi:MAG: carbohydrate-binding protein, partial [Ignavibacteriaceae bacterium]